MHDHVSSAFRDRQQARIDLRFGRAARVRVGVSVTGAGLLAVGGLVSAILLSSAAVVRASAGVATAARDALPGR